jgi:DNA gyrase/topoisomerase IV subunit B
LIRDLNLSKKSAELLASKLKEKHYLQSGVTITSSSRSESEFEGCNPTLQGFSQGELNDLIRDLNLSKKSAELLASKLKEKHYLQSGVTITSYRTREQDILPYFTEENDLVYCNNNGYSKIATRRLAARHRWFKKKLEMCVTA